MNTPNWFPHYEPAVRQELFLLGYRNLTVHLVGQTVLSGLVATGAWFAAPHERVWAWLAWMMAMSLMLGAGIRGFRAQALRPGIFEDVIQQWQQAHLTMVTLTGLGWGSVGFLFVPGAQVNNLMVMTSFAGAVAYSAVSNAHDLRGFFVSVLLAMAVLLSQIPAAFDDQSPEVMGMCLLYMTVMAWVARNAHSTLIESITLRLANEILARKNAENAARAEQANRDKSEFLAAASHDLRQPVHALLLLIEAYRQQVPAAANHPLVLNIAVAGQSIGTLFNALMELSRLESGKEKPVLASFDVAESITRLLTRVRPEADRKGLQLRSHMARGLSGLMVCTDRLLFERLVGNLLANAVRYTDAGGVMLSVRPAHAATHPEGAGVWLEVWDTGLGIAPHDQARIFDPYVQLANRERDRNKGLGLGLAIVHHASELLGLGLALRSRVGRGSCFRLHLPVAMRVMAPVPDHPPTQEPWLTTVHTPNWLAGRRLLLVDDDPMIQQAMQALLGSWGMDLRCAAEGDAHVLELCGPDWTPECVLCDFRLPGVMDGIAMLDFLQNRFPNVVGILQTGELVQTVQARAEEAGYMVLFKPVDAATLAATLGTVLDRRHEERTP